MSLNSLSFFSLISALKLSMLFNAQIMPSQKDILHYNDKISGHRS
jgi:hypothetical protein